MEIERKWVYGKTMWGFSKKRFLITLGLSVVVWFGSVFVQAVMGYNTSLVLLGSGCQLTGFPIAKCIYQSKDQLPFWVIHLMNIFFWFWVIHLVVWRVGKSRE